MKELLQWKTIKEYPKFIISNTGIVKNFERNNVINPYLQHGYYVVFLHGNPTKNPSPCRLHRLIAQCFIKNPDPDNFKIVDHIDRNKLNNNIDNLRWCNASMNAKNRTPGKKNKVEQYTLKGEYLQTWDSAIYAAKQLNIKHLGIGSCCRGDVLTHKGFIWKYEKKDRLQQMNPIIDMNEYKCLGIIKGDDFSNYYISNDGSKIINNKKQKEIKIFINNSYKTVSLYNVNNAKKLRQLFVHKIINHVLKGGKYEDIIDHVNGKKDDNSIDNLEVVTTKENNIRANGRSVNQINAKTGEIIAEFRSISEACESLNKKRTNYISRVCDGKAKKSYGYKWEWG